MFKIDSNKAYSGSYAEIAKKRNKEAISGCLFTSVISPIGISITAAICMIPIVIVRPQAADCLLFSPLIAGGGITLVIETVTISIIVRKAISTRNLKTTSNQI